MKVITKFQRMFDNIVLPYIERLGIEDKFLAPLFYTLRQKSNKFRSATALLAAKLCDGSYEDVLPIATVGELAHSLIIILDDIADDDKVRRGERTAWEKYGTCFALHSAACGITVCLRVLNQLPSSLVMQIQEKFLDCYQSVCRAQIKQSILILSHNMSYNTFLEIHLGKTALGRWAITSPASIYHKDEHLKVLDDFAVKLGDAGSLKNDVENFLENDGQESFCSDIRRGNLTYPLYYYFSQCDSKEQNEFVQLFGKNLEIDYSQMRDKIITKGTIPHCLRKIQLLISEAIDLLNYFPSSPEKQLLINWAANHIIEINSNNVKMMHER